VEADLLASGELVRHDPQKLAGVLLALARRQTRRSREVAPEPE
jgi:hypothetical protein